MKQVGNFNKVSEKLKKELIKTPTSGEPIFLQLLRGSFEPNLKREVFGASRSISLSDRILDPYATEIKDDNGKIKYEGQYVDIGVPEPGKIKDGRVERCRKYWVDSVAIGIPGNGQFRLVPGNIDDMEAYEFFCLSNGNKDNPYRDQSSPPEWEIIDPAKKNREEKDKEFRELQARVKLLSKQDPEKAKQLSDLIPKEKAPAA